MPNYSVDSLEMGIEGARKNIQTFENAIDKERQTISDYYNMIFIIQQKNEKVKKCQSEMTYP